MSQVVQISLDNRGHIFIPAALRRRLGLSPGMRLIVEEADNRGVRLRIEPETSMLVNKGGVLVVTAKPLSDMTDITRRERNGRVTDLLQRAGL